MSTVAVIGNGAAGALVVASVLREATRRGRAVDVAWIGDGEPGRGVAYATPHRWHRLNAPAPAMTLGEADLSFPDWLEAQGLGDDPFAPRYAFGTYLVETLDAARATAGPGVALTGHRERAVHLAERDDDVRVGLRSGTVVPADRVVLALGPFPSPALPGLPREVEGDPRVIADPWDGQVERITDDETVLLAGTGLTMVDVALTVGRRAPGARMIAVSRSGMLPRDHVRDEGDATGPAVRPRDGLGLDRLVDGVERAVGERGGRWREVVDGLRPVTPDLWRSLSPHDQRRFLDEQARRWETHRHRMAPSVADELTTLRDAGRLRLHSGGVRIGLDDGLLHATPGDTGERHVVHRVVSCIGAQEDVTAVDDALVRSLLDAGRARPHPLGLGFDTGPHGLLRGSGRVHGVGVLRRGELYESTAVPEIHDQAADLARHLLDPG